MKVEGYRSLLVSLAQKMLCRVPPASAARKVRAVRWPKGLNGDVIVCCLDFSS